MKRVLLVVDVSNLYYTIRKNLKGSLDYEKLIQFIIQPGEELYRAIAYGAFIDNSTDKFIQLLNHLGYETKYKEVRSYKDDSGNTMRKADWDVGIAMDVVRILDHVDVVVFGTADGDMVDCLDYVNSRGKQCRIIGSGISNQLKDNCKWYHEIGPELLRNENEATPNRESVAMRDSLVGDTTG